MSLSLRLYAQAVSLQHHLYGFILKGQGRDLPVSQRLSSSRMCFFLFVLPKKKPQGIFVIFVLFLIDSRFHFLNSFGYFLL